MRANRHFVTLQRVELGTSCLISLKPVRFLRQNRRRHKQAPTQDPERRPPLNRRVFALPFFRSFSSRASTPPSTFQVWSHMMITNPIRRNGLYFCTEMHWMVFTHTTETQKIPLVVGPLTSIPVVSDMYYPQETAARHLQF